MGRLILALAGLFIVVMLISGIIAKLMALFWIAVIVLIGIGVMRLVFSAGRRSGRE